MANRHAALAFEVARPWIVRSCGEVQAALVPHHFVAAPLTAASLAGIKRSVKTVVLLVPDHRNISSHPVSMSLAYWKTTHLTVEPARELAAQLAAEKVAVVDEVGFEHEHAVTDVVPFISHAFGPIKFLPLRFRGLDCQAHLLAAQRVGQVLARHLGSDGLVVASVDFVHDQPSRRAAAADQRSLRALRSLQPSQLCDVQADSPLALAAWLAFGQARGADRFVKLKRSDSFWLGASEAKSVVSYLTGHLTKNGGPPVSVVAVGDVMLGRNVNAAMAERQDFEFPFARVAAPLRAADIAVANLEAQLVSPCPLVHSGFKFCADPRAVDGLIRAGIDVVSVANNHSRDFGKAGLAQSVRRLRQAGVAVAGYDGPALLQRRGQRFAVLGYDAVVGPFSPQRMVQQIAAADKTAKALVVLLHWGREQRSEPNALQQRLADQAVGAGAELVVGAHPHVRQPLRRLGDGWVAFSLGNFVFDQLQSAATRQGAVATCTFCQGRPVGCQLAPVWLSPPGVPGIIGVGANTDQPAHAAMVSTASGGPP